ncbi:hypothetical protein MUU53_03810 [Rhizobium lemnae]|uniref:Uncharacterized protein n=1 Tax=Rhizobium lemnae TaxID=1214924 RepID=A0ABV8EAX4_9HYPH|nr:hypothetical protein [Rhizobium lemnae]MCJ8507033.1 hypothetical protein [Rhizobium lemnae]
MQKQVIEYDGIPVGIAVPHSGKLRFIAVKFHVIDLDNGLYTDAGEVRAAIRQHLNMAQPLAA